MMDLTLTEALNIGLIMFVYLIVAFLFLRRQFSPSARRWFIVLTAVDTFITICYMLPKTPNSFWAWFFSSIGEEGAGAVFSTVQLLAVALCAGVIGWYHTNIKPWARLYWLAFAAFFVFLAADEYYSIHESVMGWQQLYVLAGVTTVGLTILYFRFVLRKHYRTLALMVVGLALMAIGGIGFERFANYGQIEIGGNTVLMLSCEQDWSFIRCPFFGFPEEFFEMVGVTLVLATLLTYAETQLPHPNWRTNRRVVIAGSAIAAAWFFSWLWLVPTGEVALAAHSIQATLGSDLEITGYRISSEVLHPGDNLDVTVYVRAQHFLNRDYSMSLHLYTHPDVQSMGQDDMELGEWKYPTSAWLPGLAVRNRFEIHVPDDAPTDQSYWLVAQIWSGDWQSGGVAIVESDHPLLDADTLILDSLPILPIAALIMVPTTTNYRFNDGFSLEGYRLPATAVAGQPVDLNFWWQAQTDVNRDLIQFVHFFPESGDAYQIFDGVPFNGSFPTQDWPAGMNTMQTWEGVLPADMPPGTYTIRTGFYDATTHDRALVSDAQGHPVQDFSIPIGTITVTEPGS